MAAANRLPKTGASSTQLDPAPHGLSEVHFLGIHSQPKAREGLVPHFHPGYMEICYQVRGEVIFSVGGRDYRLKGNEVFWTHADEAHGSGYHAYDKGLLYWTQIRLPQRPMKFLALSREEAWPLVQALRSLPARKFRGDARLRTLFERAFLLCRQPPSPLVRLGLVTHIAEWLRTVVECAGRSSVPPPSEDIARALALVDARVESPPSVGELAAAAGLSASRFKAKFREETGIPPAEYVLRQRVRRARRMLEETRASVTEIAYRLGFSSSQYFAHAFRRFMHIRPSDVRRSAAAGRGKLPAPVPFYR